MSKIHPIRIKKLDKKNQIVFDTVLYGLQQQQHTLARGFSEKRTKRTVPSLVPRKSLFFMIGSQRHKIAFVFHRESPVIYTVIYSKEYQLENSQFQGSRMKNKLDVRIRQHGCSGCTNPQIFGTSPFAPAYFEAFKAELLQLKLTPIICLVNFINKKVGNRKN